MSEKLLAFGRRLVPAQTRRARAIGTVRSAYWLLRIGLEHHQFGLPADPGLGLSGDERYQLWLKKHVNHSSAVLADKLTSKPDISILMDARNGSEEQARNTMQSMQRQGYRNWKVIIAREGDTVEIQSSEGARETVHFDSALSGGGIVKRLLSHASGQFLSLVRAGDVLHEEAFVHVVKAVNINPDVQLIYTDEDSVRPDGTRVNPFFKPDWSPDLLLSFNYIGRLAVYSTELAMKAMEALPDGVDEERVLALAVAEMPSKIVHVPIPLYGRAVGNGNGFAGSEHSQRAVQLHLRRRGIRGEVVDGGHGLVRVKHELPDSSPIVSIIIITHDMVGYLRRCLDSLRQRTNYPNYEIVIVDHRSMDPATRSYLAGCQYKVLRYDGSFNFARINNLGVRETKGELIVFLNNDTEVSDPNWLAELVSVAQSREEVGVVGAKLLYPDGSIQHAGVVLGVGGTAAHSFVGLDRDAPGYFGLAQARRNCAAVTAACMLTKRVVFDRLGGFDETFSVGGNDVDYCLRARLAGYLTVYTPYAVLMHHEGVTRGKGFPPKNHYYFVRKWKEAIRRGDPYYNPNLSLHPQSLYLPEL